jgi:hypothetical protein
VSDELEWQPGRWWRVVHGDGQVWCETSSEKEARDALARCPAPGTLQRLFERHESQWRTAEDSDG